MYSLEFCNIYNDYGWDYFSITMGEAILKYFSSSNREINKHLDLGCGVGTLCNYFHSKNIKTKGIDISNDMVEICKRKNEKVDFVKADIETYLTDEKYDLITMTCDVVNHILEEDKLEKIFTNIYNMLDDDGYFIFDIYDKNCLVLNSEIVSNRDNGVKVYYYITEDGSLINTNVKIMNDGNLVFEYDVLEKLYDTLFIKELLVKCNFKIVKSDNKIWDEKQRFEDKIYIICTK